MSSMRLALDYTREKKDYRISRRWIRHLLLIMMEHFPKTAYPPVFGKFDRSKAYYISVAIVGDNTIHKINREYRGKDKITDVISLEGERDDFIASHELEHDLGEVIICYPQTRRQALELGVPLRDEFLTLLIHGFLHVLGYDHIKDRDYRIMEPLERKMMAVVKKQGRR